MSTMEFFGMALPLVSTTLAARYANEGSAPTGADPSGGRTPVAVDVADARIG